MELKRVYGKFINWIERNTPLNLDYAKYESFK